MKLCAFALLLCCFACGPKHSTPAAVTAVLFPDSISQGLALVTDSAGPFLHSMDSLAAALKGYIDPHDADKSIPVFLRAVYQERGMLFDAEPDVMRNVLPQEAWNNGRGGCLGAGFVLLTLAEKLNLPLHGVLLPGHFFLRWDDVKSRINIEPNLNGFNHPDSYYCARYDVANDSFYTLRSLSRKEALATLSYGLGSCFLKSGNAEKAAQCFANAAANFPSFAEAFGNLGVAQVMRKDTAAALQAFRSAQTVRPGLKGLSGKIDALSNERRIR